MILFLGNGIESSVPAKEAWVHLVTSLEEPLKLPVGYFLIHSLNAAERAKVIKQTICHAYDNNVLIVALTLDGPNVNKDTIRCLGASIDPKSSLPYFKHPIDPNIKVFCFLDPAHAIKLVRNHFATKKLWSASGEIDFSYFRKLHNLQTKLQLKLGKNIFS